MSVNRRRVAKRVRKKAPTGEGRLRETGPTPSEAVRKRRLRSLKRETRPAKEGPGPAPQGQRKAIRGNRVRQRRT